MNIQSLHAAVAATAPIHGISVGRKNDKSTWRIDYTDEATDEQKVAAQAVIDAFDPDAPSDAEINVERDRRIALGVTVAVSGSGNIPVQTRDDVDFRNINGLSTSALALKAAGAPGGLQFRDADDVTHDLTYDQMIELGLLVSAAVSALYAKAWALKAMDPRPVDYTDDSYWT